MIKSIAPRRVRVVANDRQAFGVCRHVADLEWRALVTAELGVNFWYFSVFGERRARYLHNLILPCQCRQVRDAVKYETLNTVTY